MFLSRILTEKKKHSPKFKNEKTALIVNHLHHRRGRSLETMTVRGELVLNSNNVHRTMHDGSDQNDTLVPTETCFTNGKEKSSDGDSVSVNESDSDTELPSPAKRRCCYL